jgi:folate-binding protein YgfZ
MSDSLDSTVIQFDGPDVRQVLQGQTTRNFAKAGIQTPMMGAFCDLKGRVLTDFLAFITNDSQVLMRVHSSVADKLLEHLKKYLMFSKSDAVVTDLEVRGFARAPESTGNLVSGPDCIDRNDGLIESWTTTPTKMPGGVQPLDSGEWEHELTKVGDAQIVANTWGAYLPQDLNYDLRGLIDFDKGCYTGQEIVARLHYRGTPKRRLARLVFSKAIALEPGCPIQDRATQRGVGSIAQCATLSGRTLALAELAVTAVADSLIVGEDSCAPSIIEWL